MKRILSFSLLLAFGCAIAQFNISAELRPRFEYRHGYKTLMPDDVKAASFVSPRTRLNTQYVHENLKLYLSGVMFHS